jgi:hypothetical protein
MLGKSTKGGGEVGPRTWDSLSLRRVVRRQDTRVQRCQSRERWDPSGQRKQRLIDVTSGINEAVGLAFWCGPPCT